jgi:hypothetical protein
MAYIFFDTFEHPRRIKAAGQPLLGGTYPGMASPMMFECDQIGQVCNGHTNAVIVVKFTFPTCPIEDVPF